MSSLASTRSIYLSFHNTRVAKQTWSLSIFMLHHRKATKTKQTVFKGWGNDDEIRRLTTRGKMLLLHQPCQFMMFPVWMLSIAPLWRLPRIWLQNLSFLSFPRKFFSVHVLLFFTMVVMCDEYVRLSVKMIPRKLKLFTSSSCVDSGLCLLLLFYFKQQSAP